MLDCKITYILLSDIFKCKIIYYTQYFICYVNMAVSALVCLCACVSTSLREWVVTREGAVIAQSPNNHPWGEIRMQIT